MKNITPIILVVFATSIPGMAGEYVDHRGHNVDSLEAVVAPWTADKIAKADEADLSHLNRDWRELMLGYLQVNEDRSRHFARKALAMALEENWNVAIWDAAKVLGQHLWASEAYDSAAFYYNIALNAIERMQVGDKDPEHPEGITQTDIDNGLSAMYGTLGNLYSMQDSISLAMDYYSKAGEIFQRYGWNSSLSCLEYNIGETWREEGELRKAEEAYKRGMAFAEEAGDSLWIAANKAGMGTLELKRGHLNKAIRLLDDARAYYSLHKEQEPGALMESTDYTNQILRLQKRQAKTGLILSLIALFLLAALTVYIRRIAELKKEKFQTEALLEETLEELVPATGKEEIKLTDREIQILNLIAEGRTNKQIADKIFLSPETIKWYRKKLLTKFNASSASALISEAYKNGFLKK